MAEATWLEQPTVKIPDGTVAAGTVVRARPEGWRETAANNALPEPDPVLPEGGDEWITGPVSAWTVTLPWGDTETRVLIGNVYVDPATITPAAKKGLIGPDGSVDFRGDRPGHRFHGNKVQAVDGGILTVYGGRCRGE